MVTPTPLSATTNRLIPVLQEANGLYISMALLDSALGSNLSEMQINKGPHLSAIQTFIQFGSRRMKLDSVAESMETGGGIGSATDLLNCQDEKPMMTFGIADYPSLGFMEELVDMGAPTQGASSCNTLYGSLSKFISVVSTAVKEETGTDPETGMHVWLCVVRSKLPVLTNECILCACMRLCEGNCVLVCVYD